MRNRRGLNKIGMLAMAMVLALGVMGTAYGAWVDEIYVEGTLSTAAVNTTLECGTCSLTGNPTGANTSISCSDTLDPLEVEISVSNAQALTDYKCLFTVDNTASGTLPVKIVSVTLAPSGTYADVSAAITILPAPTVLDPGYTTTTAGEVHISLTSAASVGLPLEYTLTAEVVRWNE